MPVTYGWEPLQGLLLNDGFSQAAAAHWADIALDRDDVPLVVAWHRYLAREEAGALRIFTARRDGKLAGAIGFGLSRPDKHITTLHIVEEIAFVTQDQSLWQRGILWREMWRQAVALIDDERRRSGGATVKLITAARLPKSNVTLLMQTIGRKVAKARFLGQALPLQSLGLRPAEVVFTLILK